MFLVIYNMCEICMLENIFEHIGIYAYIHICFNDKLIYHMYIYIYTWDMLIKDIAWFYRLSNLIFAFEAFIRSKYCPHCLYKIHIYMYIQYMCIRELNMFNIYIYWSYQCLGINDVYESNMWLTTFLSWIGMLYIYMLMAHCNINHMQMII